MSNPDGSSMEGLSGIIGSMGLPWDEWLLAPPDLEDLGVLSLRTSGDSMGVYASMSSSWSWSVPIADLEIVVIPLPRVSPTLLIKLGYFRKFFFLPSSYSFFTDCGPFCCTSSISENLTADFGSDIKSSLSAIFPFRFYFFY